MPVIKTLKYRRVGLADPEEQIAILNSEEKVRIPSFEARLKDAGKWPLKTTRPEILQVNVGKKCNQTCKHCHVDAGPDRKEMMSEEVMDACLDALKTGDFNSLDITGGAPEIHPGFRSFVTAARPLVDRILVRSNLTIIMSNPKYRDLPYFFAENHVEVVSSLPFYQESNTDRQRGDGVFRDSVQAIRALNKAGYGMEDSQLKLTLVSNPTGSFLPAGQTELEQIFREKLREDHGIEFTNLITLTNMPIGRFLEFLHESGNLTSYMDRLNSNFNASTVDNLMCRNTISVSWDGRIYNCDFNQMLELEAEGCPTILNYSQDSLTNSPVKTSQHCFGCTAGAGSSCGGSLSNE